MGGHPFNVGVPCEWEVVGEMVASIADTMGEKIHPVPSASCADDSISNTACRLLARAVGWVTRDASFGRTTAAAVRGCWPERATVTGDRVVRRVLMGLSPGTADATGRVRSSGRHCDGCLPHARARLERIVNRMQDMRSKG